MGQDPHTFPAFSACVNLRPEHELILACARTGSVGAERANALLNGSLDWEFLSAQANEQAVLQLVQQQVATRYADRVPEPVLAHMAEECRWLTQLSQALTRELLDLLTQTSYYQTIKIPC